MGNIFSPLGATDIYQYHFSSTERRLRGYYARQDCQVSATAKHATLCL